MGLKVTAVNGDALFRKHAAEAEVAIVNLLTGVNRVRIEAGSGSERRLYDTSDPLLARMAVYPRFGAKNRGQTARVLVIPAHSRRTLCLRALFQALSRALCLALCLALSALLLGGCASRAPPSGARDGPPPIIPADIASTPDAVPRVEPIRQGGPNKPYEVFGQRYVPIAADLPLRELGGASWYGSKFHGRPTSSGEPYDMLGMTAAHKTMPIPSFARVRNPANGREVVVRVNDRGPFVAGRVIDLSYAAAAKLGVLRGVTPVEVLRLTHDEIRSGFWLDAGAVNQMLLARALAWPQLGHP
jgi:rare lipoprotein A